MANADAVYLANVLAERACPLCGTDRRRVRPSAATPCAECGALLYAGTEFIRWNHKGAYALCSRECLTRFVPHRLSVRCALCDAPWPAEGPRTRGCGTCPNLLEREAEHVALARAGRVRAFCGIECLDAYLARPNPFCG